MVRCQHLMLTLAIFDLTFLLTIPSVLTSFYFLTTDDIDTTLFNITYILMQFRFRFAWKGSVFTTVAITLERYLVDCRSININKYSFLLTLSIIVISALVLSLPALSFTANFLRAGLKSEADNYMMATAILHFIAVGLFPPASLIYMNMALKENLGACREQLKSFRRRGSVCPSSIANVKKSVYQANFAFIITCILLRSQILSWIPMIVKVTFPSFASF